MTFTASELRTMADDYDLGAADYGFDIRISEALRQAADDCERLDWIARNFRTCSVDMGDGHHKDFGSGLFTTHDCVRTVPTSQPQPVAQGEAVAWQIRFPRSGTPDWTDCTKAQYEATLRSGHGYGSPVMTTDFEVRELFGTPTIPTGHRIVPVEPPYEVIKAMCESVAHDDEGYFPPVCDLIDYSGENKRHTVVRQMWIDGVNAAPTGGKL